VALSALRADDGRRGGTQSVCRIGKSAVSRT
jgi:hypothetical protein